jgi:hypothetical protein
MTDLPRGDYNLPPGVTLRDIDGGDDGLPEEPCDIWDRMDDADKRRIAIDWAKSGRDFSVVWLDELDPSSPIGQSWREFRDAEAIEQNERENGRL